MYIVDVTTNSVMSWISGDADNPSSYKILWLPAERTNVAAFLHFFGEKAAERALRIANLVEPDHEVIAVETRQFLTNRVNGVYDKPEAPNPWGQNEYERAYAEGSQARSEGLKQADNPYQITNLKGIGWLNGWVDGWQDGAESSCAHASG